MRSRRWIELSPRARLLHALLSAESPESTRIDGAAPAAPWRKVWAGGALLVAAAYHNRALARFPSKAHDEAWDDVGVFRNLGGTPSQSFVTDPAKGSSRSE
jgi:hypothetical protein